jgi:hypothetical protein
MEPLMKRLLTLAAVSAALMTSACITVNDNSPDGGSWRSTTGQSLDASREDCHRTTDSRAAFDACMAEKGWSRS